MSLTTFPSPSESLLLTEAAKELHSQVSHFQVTKEKTFFKRVGFVDVEMSRLVLWAVWGWWGALVGRAIVGHLQN